MLYCRRYADFASAGKSFQLDNRVYCDLIYSTSDFCYLVLSKSFLNSEILLIVILQLLYDVIYQVEY